MTGEKRVLVAGATGYIGGRLVPRLLERGWAVRCLARHPEHLEGRPWPGAETVQCDLLHPHRLDRILEGVDTAYYLVHSMAELDPDFEAHDAQAAKNFAEAAAKAGVRRVIYLGALGESVSSLSRHLRSRQKVGSILRGHGLDVTEFRAAVIVGSGSSSFEIIRYLMERMPFTLRFGCLKTRCQPIAIRDVLSYLVQAAEVEESAGKTLEIGGASILSYEEMLRVYARIRGLNRFFIPSPCLSPRSCTNCARWVGLVTPIPTSYALPLLESLRSEVVCRDDTALRMFPVKPLDYETAVRYALRRISENAVETTWTMALLPQHSTFHAFIEKEGLSFDRRVYEVAAPAHVLFYVFSGVGGRRGWFFWDWIWTLRGAIDRMLGGVGMRRGRRHPDELHQGEPLDFWRVERVVPDELLLLRAEMKLPGKGWLQFESSPREGGGSLLKQTAYFEPKGISGHLYWRLLYPLHRIIFRRLAEEIKRRAESLHVRSRG